MSIRHYSWLCSTCQAASRDGDDMLDDNDKCIECGGEVHWAVVGESIDWGDYDHIRSDQLDRFRLADGADQLPIYQPGYMLRRQAGGKS